MKTDWTLLVEFMGLHHLVVIKNNLLTLGFALPKLPQPVKLFRKIPSKQRQQILLLMSQNDVP